MKKHIYLLLIALFCGVASAMAQKTVSGNVTDTSGEPLIGVSVTVEGSKIGAVTDIDGNYTLKNVPNDATIKFAYFGMASQDIKSNGRTTINVEMKEDNLRLDEVVVIGYGSAKAKDLTAPITTVSGSEISSIPSSSPMAALAGKVPGVNVINSGVPVQVRQFRFAVLARSQLLRPSMLSTACSMTTSTGLTTTIFRTSRFSRMHLPQLSTV